MTLFLFLRFLCDPFSFYLFLCDPFSVYLSIDVRVCVCLSVAVAGCVYVDADPAQIILLKQEQVPALSDSEARFALQPEDPSLLVTKPHGVQM